MRTGMDRGWSGHEARLRDRQKALASRGHLISRLKKPDEGPQPPSDEAESNTILPDSPPFNAIERIAFGEARERGPDLLSLLVSIAVNGTDPAPTCIVLPTARCVGAATAILAALEFLSRDLSCARQSYLAVLKPGTRVRLLPNREIFEIGEVDELGIRLRLVDVKNYRSRGSKVVPLDRIGFLEPTDRQYPYGAPDTKIVVPPEGDADLIVGHPFHGNAGLVKTRVLLVGTRAEFEHVLQGLSAAPQSKNTGIPLCDAFPFGGIDESGFPFVVQPPGSAGQPLVAISNRLSTVVPCALRRDVEPKSLVVLTDKVDAVLNELGAAGRIAEQQKLILFADARKRADLEPLRRQGWTIWEPSPTEIERRASDTSVRVGCAGIDESVLAARREQDGKIDHITCESRELVSAEEAMVALGELLGHESVADEDWAQQLREDAQGLFFSISNWLIPPPEATMERISTKARGMLMASGRLEGRFGPGCAAPLRAFVDAATAFYDRVSRDGISPKGTALLLAAADHAGQLVFVGGARQACDEAEALLRSRGRSEVVLSVDRMADSLPHVVGLGMLRRASFEKLFDPWPAPKIGLLGYDFESVIYRARIRRRSALRARSSLGDEKKSMIAGFRVADAPPVSTASPSAAPDAEMLALEKIERTVTEWRWQRRISVPRAEAGEAIEPARVVRFAGRSWCAMTDDHRTVVLRAGGSGARTSTATVDTLEPGDRIIVREGGDKDVIRLLAEDRVGAEKYAQLRRSSRLWREALVGSGLGLDDLADRLAAAGVNRDKMTLRHWLHGEHIIAPRAERDIFAIADLFPVAGKTKKEWQACVDAVHQVRALHLSAGSRLSEILIGSCGRVLLEPSETEIVVDLGLGLVWVLEVASVEETHRGCPASFVNRLQWLDTDWRDALLAAPLAKMSANP